MNFFIFEKYMMEILLLLTFYRLPINLLTELT